MLALGLESILISHVAQCDDVALGIAVAVRASLHHHQLLMLLDDLSVGGLCPGDYDLLQVTHILYANAIGGLVTI